ncbi:Aminoglycoside phosphotransferase family protein OS=Streptomyces tendae OX=1932 GN=F3L20_12630 PE=4 SV=1 [Streptomyces tendae]
MQLAAQAGSAVLVHHALTGGNLVVGADGRVRGVLGWDSAVVGDPAEDIAGLARAVGAPPPSARPRWRATARAPACAASGWPAATASSTSPKPWSTTPRTPFPLLRTRLRRAWEPIMLERVTDLRDSDAAP